MLSVCMPSNRSLKECRASIEDISRLSKLYQVESILYDNSFDSIKSKYVQSEGCISIYNRNAPSGAVDNWRECIQSANREYLLMMGDDDRVNFLADPNVFLSNLYDQDIGVRPIFIPYSKENGVLSVETFSTDADDAKTRLEQYFSMNGGKNLSFYSIYKKSIFSELMHDFYSFHPTRAGYTDWPLVLALVSMGKIKSNKNIIFYYCIDNWISSGNALSSNESIFKSAGLPLDAICIQPALTALDSFGLIGRKKSRLPIGEKHAASVFAMNAYYNSLIISLEGINKDNRSNKISLALDLISEDVNSTSERLLKLLTVVETWIPGLSKKYQIYFEKTVDPEIFDIID